MLTIKYDGVYSWRMDAEFHCELHSMQKGWSSGMYNTEDERLKVEELLKRAEEITKRCGGCIGSDCLVYQFLEYIKRDKEINSSNY